MSSLWNNMRNEIKGVESKLFVNCFQACQHGLYTRPIMHLRTAKKTKQNLGHLNGRPVVGIHCFRDFGHLSAGHGLGWGHQFFPYCNTILFQFLNYVDVFCRPILGVATLLLRIPLMQQEIRSLEVLTVGVPLPRGNDIICTSTFISHAESVHTVREGFWKGEVCFPPRRSLHSRVLVEMGNNVSSQHNREPAGQPLVFLL